MAYNNTALLKGNNTLFDLANEINVLSDGLYATLTLLVVYIMIIMIMKEKFDIKVITVLAGFTVTLFAITFLGLEWVGFNVVIIPLVLFIGSLGYLIASR